MNQGICAIPKVHMQLMDEINTLVSSNQYSDTVTEFILDLYKDQKHRLEPGELTSTANFMLKLDPDL